MEIKVAFDKHIEGLRREAKTFLESDELELVRANPQAYYLQGTAYRELFLST